jgi:predicted TIM-barrel fold metal-dependent hydrolase
MAESPAGADRKLSPPPIRETKKPKFKAPPGACDTHFHIYGPQRRFPLSPMSPYVFEDAGFEDLIRLHDTLGIARGVVVQSMAHGHSYEYMIDALCRAPDRLRGIAMPAPTITDRELEILDSVGVVGARFAYRWSPEFDRRTLARIQEIGWHPQFWFRGEAEALAWRGAMLAVQGDFVIDHMGWQPADKGIDSAGFRVVLDCLDSGRCWVKLWGRTASLRKPFPMPTRCPSRTSWCAARPNDCCGAPTGRIRTIGRRCRTTATSWTCSRDGCPTRRSRS